MKILRDLRAKGQNLVQSPNFRQTAPEIQDCPGFAAVPVRTWSRRVRVRVRAAVRRVRRTRLGRLGCSKGAVRLLPCITALAAVSGAAGVYHVYFDRNDLPDMEGFNRRSEERRVGKEC